MNQISFISIAQKKKLKCKRFLDEMKKVIPWERLTSEIAPYYQEQQQGRKKKELLLMMKIYFLQQWYGLSDHGAEEAIYDRISFQKFLKLDLLSQGAPDETTILNFRHLLEKHNLQKKLFLAVKKHLETKGMIVKAGTIVDATLIAAPSSTKNEEKQRDPDMSSTKKGHQWYFGMNAHIGVDTKSGLVHTVATTTARVHDSQAIDELLHGKEKAVFGDKRIC